MKTRRFAPELLELLAIVLFSVLFVRASPPGPDDWDGIGFVLSIGKFDLDHFTPHPPGYPVYVALLRAAHVFFADPVRAARVVSGVSGAVAVVAFSRAARVAFGAAAGVAVAIALLATPLFVSEATAIESEACALAFTACALVGLVHAHACGPRRSRDLLTGFLLGLALGVRASWAPLFVGLAWILPRKSRASVATGSFGGVVVWAVPFVAIVGPAHLARLLCAHLIGHMTEWGGTALHEPAIDRAAYFARDILVDGLGMGAEPLGMLIAILVTIFVLCTFSQMRGVAWALVALGPYVVWIALGQNLKEAPRHALPCVVALAGALGVAASRARSRVIIGMGALVALTMASRAWCDVAERARVLPAGAQLVAFVRAMPHPERVAVFGARSIRFFELTEFAHVAHLAATLGDVHIAYGRISPAPERVFVTSEIDLLGGRESPMFVASFCRPPRIDRRAPCIKMLELTQYHRQ